MHYAWQGKFANLILDYISNFSSRLHFKFQFQIPKDISNLQIKIKIPNSILDFSLDHITHEDKLQIQFQLVNLESKMKLQVECSMSMNLWSMVLKILLNFITLNDPRNFPLSNVIFVSNSFT